MLPDNSTQILRSHDLVDLRNIKSISTVALAAPSSATSSASVPLTTTTPIKRSPIAFGGISTSNGNSGSIANHHSTIASTGNVVFSTLPFEGRTLLIQPTTKQTRTLLTTSLAPPATNGTLVTTTTATNGLRGSINNNSNNNISNNSAAHNINNLLVAANLTSKATFIKSSGTTISNNNNNTNNNHISNNNNSNGNLNSNTISSHSITSMPSTSKYVFVRQNGNVQFTPFEGSATTSTATAAAIITSSSSNIGNGPPHSRNGNGVGNIVLLATEPLELTDSGSDQQQQQHIITTTTGGDNDEELRSLSWLNDSNLIKGIVTTTSGANVLTHKNGGIAAKQHNLGSNICIVNANNAHDLIEELSPQSVASEEVLTTTTNGATPLSVNDFQQQFIASSKRYGSTTVGGGSGGGSAQVISSVSGFTISTQPHHKDAQASASNLVIDKEHATSHIFSPMAALGARTSVHVGPSGTTTVVEYKSNSNFISTPRQLVAGGSAAAKIAVNATTITATNLSNKNEIVHNNNNNSSNNNNVPSSSTQSTGIITPTTAAAVAAVTAATSSISNGNSHNTTPPTSAAGNTLTVPLHTSAQSAATAIGKHLTVVTSAGGNAINIANGNATTNTIYQGQKQSTTTSSSNNNNNNTNSGSNNNNNNGNAIISSPSSTTHHPHKKYLREKMNILEQHGNSSNSNNSNNNNVNNINNSSNINNNNNNNNTTSTSAITVVASPASSNNSSLSSASFSSSASSTAAVNGEHSPVPKTFYTGVGSTTTSMGPVNYSNSSNSSSASSAGAVASSSPPASASSPHTNGIPTFTVVHPNQHVESPSGTTLSLFHTSNSGKEYYRLSTTPNSYHQQQQQLISQQQQSQQQGGPMRSPVSYTSYDNDSLKDFEISTNTNSSSSGMRQNPGTPQRSYQPHQMSTPSPSGKSGGGGSNVSSTQKQKHPNNVPYDPLIHTHNKPPYSFSSLIFMAIEGSREKALPVKEIYAWIVQHFPYFKTAPTGWKNSVRHNLSLNKSFVKVEKAPNMGKGSLWRVEQQQRPNLIQALTRSPYFPNSAVDKIDLKGSANYDVVDGNEVTMSKTGSNATASGSLPNNAAATAGHINHRFDPILYPKLSKVMSEHDGLLADVPDDDVPSDYSTTNHNNNNNNKYSYGSAESTNGSINNSNGAPTLLLSNYASIERLARDCGANSIDDVNAAAAMLALKHGPKVFSETFQNGAPVITSSPSEDHTYSAGGGSAAGSGASTPLTNGSYPNQLTGTNGSNGQPNGCDSQSNCASSDAAYESSEESHNAITPEEIADQRHRDGVDALLSLSLSSVIDSPPSNTPMNITCKRSKRPASTSVEEEYISASIDNSISSSSSPQYIVPAHMNNNNNNNKMDLLSSAAAYASTPQQHHNHSILDEGYSTQSYANNHQTQQQQQHHHQVHNLSISTTPKKPKPIRNLRSKIKRKSAWMR